MREEAPTYLKDWRIVKGLTQAELARRVGTVKSEISRLERGSRRMTLHWMKTLAPALGISVDDLIALPPTGSRAAFNVQPKASMQSRDADWSTAQLGDVKVGVSGGLHTLTTYTGDDWPGLFAPGDVLVVDEARTSTGAPGLFAVTIGGETIIRRVDHADGQVVLTCGNPAYQPITLGEGMKVLGRVVGQVRRL
jgi:transcriptional regulator with XRE-family HTH domain